MAAGLRALAWRTASAANTAGETSRRRLSEASVKAVQLAAAVECQGCGRLGVSCRDGQRSSGRRKSAKTSSAPGAPLPVESDTCRVVRELTVAAGRFAPGHLG